MKPQGGLIIDVLAGPSEEEPEGEPAPEAPPADPGKGMNTDPAALLDNIEAQLAALRAQLAR